MTEHLNRAGRLRRRTFRRWLVGGAGAAALLLGSLAPAAAAAGPDDALVSTVAESLPGNYLAARFAGSQSDLAASARFFAEALADDPDDPFLLERTLALSLAAGDIESATMFADRLADVDKSNRLAALTLGIDALHDKRWAVAVETLKRADAGPLANLTVEVLSAWAEAGSGQVDKAFQRLDRMQGEEWFAFFRAYHGGLIAAVAGRKDEAVSRLKAAYDADNGSIRVIEAYARALARAGKPDQAKALLDEAMATVPEHPLLSVIGEDIAKGRMPRPLVGSVDQGAAEILAGLGAAIARDDTGELASVYLQLALWLDPKADLARITLAEIFERSKQYEKAIDLLNGVSATSPLKRNAEIQIGFDYNALDKVDEARKHLGKLVAENPADLEAVTALGNVLRVRRMFKEAAEVYSKGIASLEKAEPSHWTLFYNRGIAYERTDRWPEAEADFKKALELQPDQPLVLNYLGYSWVDKGMNYDEALAMIRKAVELEPTDGYIVDSLGWVYFKLGRYDEAVVQLERAVELKPEDPVINDHLGDAYWQVGRKLEARFQWSHAKDRNPEPADLEKILKKLQDGLPNPEGPAAAQATPVKPATQTP